MAGRRKITDLVGQRFGLLEVLSRAPGISVPGRRVILRSAWLCRCDCGRERVVRDDFLRRGLCKSCGVGHHYSKNRVRSPSEYRCYGAMLQRCYNPNVPNYKDYGAKGVTVCERWRTSFDNFYADMGPRPSAKYSLDRYPNYAGNYEPGNVRWATDEQQARNRADNIRVIWNDRVITLAEYAAERGLNAQMLIKRLRRGWSVEHALLAPAKSRKRDLQNDLDTIEVFYKKADE